MWFVVLLTLCSAALPQYDFINVYRISIGWVQLGVFEIGLFVGLLLALVKGGDYASYYPAARKHPVFFWLIALFSIGSLMGIIGTFGGIMPLKYKVAGIREFVAMPICIIMGYRLLATPRQSLVYAYISILAGAITATGVFFYFNSSASEIQVSGSISSLRASIKQFSPEYASCAGLLLLWSLAAGKRIIRPGAAFALMLYCFIGYLAMLGRTNVVIMLGGALAIFLIIPRQRIFGSAIKLIVLGPIIFFTLYGSIVLGGKIVGRYNFAEKITTHFSTLLPSERHIGESKAWDSRLGSIVQEIQLWLKNPLMGNGFASQESMVYAGEIVDTGGYNHNGWTSTLAKAGVFAFAAVVLMTFTSIVLGYRMVRDEVDRASVIFGAVAFITGVVFLIRATCTMAFISRSAIHYAMVCGMVIRAREMQQTTKALQAAGAGYEPFVDPSTGLLVPDYGLPGLAGIGSVN
jgi:hypothetical protein